MLEAGGSGAGDATGPMTWTTPPVRTTGCSSPLMRAIMSVPSSMAFAKASLTPAFSATCGAPARRSAGTLMLRARRLQPPVTPRARHSQPPVTPPCAPAVPGQVVPRIRHFRLPTRQHLPPASQSARLASTCALISLVVPYLSEIDELFSQLKP